MTLRVCWDCLLGSDASTLHAESKGSCYFLQHALQKPAVKAQTNTDLSVDAHTSGFPLTTTADFHIGRTKQGHAFKVLRGQQQNLRKEANSCTDV